MSTRRTKRRYAHEMYPHPDEWETRPLSADVPYLYAQALGHETWDTGWHDLLGADAPRENWLQASARTVALIKARELAFVADALAQGLTGDEAWKWAQERACDETGEWVWERATHYGVNPHLIRPYPCGPTPDHHEHKASTGDVTGEGFITRVQGAEVDCDACTEAEA